MNLALPEELRQLTILYAEDDDNIRLEVVHFLERRVGNLVLAANGEEALAAFIEHKPDIVISDIMMPVMDGLELAAAIKERNSAVPVILTTAFNEAKYLHQAISL